MKSPTHTILAKLGAILNGSLDGKLIHSISDEDWFTIILIANRDRHRLIPTLHCILCTDDFKGDVPDDVYRYLTLAAELNEKRNAALRHEIEQAISALNSVAIAPMLLKGAAAVMDQRRGLAARMIGDIDILVPKEQGVDALAALRQVGFSPLVQTTGMGHTIADLARPGNHACIDLHSQLFDHPFQRLLPVADVFTRAEQTEGHDMHFRLPSLQDHALHSLIHAQVSNPGYYSRQLCLGAARELVALQNAVDWDAIEFWADSYRTRFVIEAVLLATQQFFGMRWPLSRAPTQAAIRHHKRACEVEITGRWDAGISRGARLREAFAPDRLAVAFGTDHWYVVNLLQLCSRAVRQHGLRKLCGRLIAA